MSNNLSNRCISVALFFASALFLLSCNDDKRPKTTSDLIAEDSIEISTPDLTLFELKGKVKNMKDATGSYNFNKTGNLEIDPDDIKRDSANQIVELTVNDMTTTYIWNSDGQVETSNSSGMKNTYRYDDRGYLLNCFTEVDSWEMSIYKYLEFDAHGNWTTRERQYIGLSTGAEEGQDPTYKNIETEKRTIEYWDGQDK